MTSRGSRRSFLRTMGAGGVGVAGVAVGVAGSTVVHAVGHATAGEGHAMVDVGFCTDMTVHHVQALAMCQRVLGRDTGDSVQAAAAEVLQTQSIEIGMMRAWLTDWGESTAEPETAMGWMDMDGGGAIPISEMPGLASDDEMRALSVATGIEQGRLWLELMRAHHVGGVNMASAAVQMAGTEKVRRIAQVQIDVQTYEIGLYDMLLSTEYA